MNALMAVATANLLSMLMKVTSKSYMHFRPWQYSFKKSNDCIRNNATKYFLASVLVNYLGSLEQYQQQVEWGN